MHTPRLPASAVWEHAACGPQAAHVFHGAVLVGAGLHEHVDDLGVATRGGEHERCPPALLCLDGHVRAQADKRISRLGVAVHARNHERRRALLRALVDVLLGAAHELLELRSVADVRRFEEALQPGARGSLFLVLGGGALLLLPPRAVVVVDAHRNGRGCPTATDGRHNHRSCPPSPFTLAHACARDETAVESDREFAVVTTLQQLATTPLHPAPRSRGDGG